MKEINLGYIKNDNNLQWSIDFIKLILTKANSLLEIADEISDENIRNVINSNDTVNCIFYSHYNSPERIKIVLSPFDIQSFYDHIDAFIDSTYQSLSKLSLEPFDEENSSKIRDILIKNCYIYDNNIPKNLIWFFIKIFFDILTEHKLINGNKRVATMMLYKLCYYYGFFVKNSLGKDSYHYWKSNENKIIEFVEDYQLTHSSEKVQHKMYKWLIDNLYIANNFHEWKNN